MFCPKCGAMLFDNNSVCYRCGYSADSSADTGAPASGYNNTAPVLRRSKQADRSATSNLLFLLSFAVGTVYLVFLFLSLLNGASDLSNSSGWGALGTLIKQVLLLPHTVAVLCAVILNLVGCCLNSDGFALSCGIMYTVSVVLFPPNFYFVIAEAVLSFIVYAQINSDNRKRCNSCQ